MATKTHHSALSLKGCLRNFKRKKITFFQDENGRFISDHEARSFIAECLAKGWELIPIGGSKICEGFDHFGGGCPGHPKPDEETGQNPA